MLSVSRPGIVEQRVRCRAYRREQTPPYNWLMPGINHLAREVKVEPDGGGLMRSSKLFGGPALDFIPPRPSESTHHV